MQTQLPNSSLSDVVLHSSGAMQVQSLPGKGFGMVSTELIQAGDILVVEKQVLCFDEADPSRRLDKQFQDLAPDARIAVMDLFDYKASVLELLDPLQNHKTIEGVFETNRYKAMDGNPVSRLFLMFSRFNHDCNPNCTCRYDDAAGTSTITAVRQIHPGLELTLSYGVDAILAPTKSRQRFLENWGFECACSVCMACDATSDERRAKLDRLLSSFSDRGGPGGIRDERGHEEMFSLFHLENLILPSLQANIAEKMLNIVMLELASTNVSREVGLPLALKWFNRVLKYMPLAVGAASERFRAFQARIDLVGLQHALDSPAQ